MVFFEFAITGRWEGELVSHDGKILAQGKSIYLICGLTTNYTKYVSENNLKTSHYFPFLPYFR